MNKTAAVVVTYNRKALLQQCISCLLAQTAPCDILIIDNASTDGTGDLFKHSQESLTYFNTGSNLGGAGGFNFGMRKAVEMGYEFVWVMDDDTLPNATAHEKLLEGDKKLNGNYGFLSSLVLWTDGTQCRMNIPKITKWKRLRAFNKMQGVQYASFVSLFLKSDTIKQFGLPYKEFFIWSDDWEYTRRISKKCSCFFVPESTVVHACVTNTGADIVSSPADRLERFRYLYRNDVVLYRMDGFDGFIYLSMRVTFHIIKILLKSENKFKKIKLILSSLREGVKFRPVAELVGEEV